MISQKTDIRDFASMLTGCRYKEIEFKRIEWIHKELGSLAVFVNELIEICKEKRMQNTITKKRAASLFSRGGKDITSNLSTLAGQNKGKYPDIHNSVHLLKSFPSQK